MAEFNPKENTHVWQLPFEGAWPTAVAFLGSHRRLAAANRQGAIFIWELPELTEEQIKEQGKQNAKDAKDNNEPPATPPPVRRLDGHANAVTRLVATADGKTLISASLDRTVRLWDVSAPADGHAEAVMDIDRRKKQAKRTRKDDVLNAPGIKVETQTRCHVLEGHMDWVKALGISRDQKRLISGDDRAATIVWDLATRKPVSKWTGYAGDWVTSAALSPDGRLAFVGEYCARRGDFDRPPAQARLYNADDGKEMIDLLKVQFPKAKKRDNSYGYATTWGKFVKNGFVASAFSPDGALLALAQGGETDKGQVHLIDVKTGKLVRTVSGHRYGATDVAFTDDGKHVLSCGRDTTVRVCQVSDGKEVAQLGKSRGGQFKDWLHQLSLSADQQWLAAADMAGIIHVWRFGV